MATGFIRASSLRLLVDNSIRAGAALTCLAMPAAATEVAVAGVFPGKAVLVIDGGAPRTVGVGARTPEGVRLVAVQGDEAVVEIGGRRESVRMAGAVATAASTAGGPNIMLNADAQGHFVTAGSINGAGVNFLVDTGASLVSMGIGDATRAGIDFRKGEPLRSMTANGVIEVWRVKLDAVRVGGVTLRNVDGAVHAQDLPVVLLGMSFLNRMDMQHEGDRLILRQRY